MFHLFYHAVGVIYGNPPYFHIYLATLVGNPPFHHIIRHLVAR